MDFFLKNVSLSNPRSAQNNETQDRYYDLNDLNLTLKSNEITFIMSSMEGGFDPIWNSMQQIRYMGFTPLKKSTGEFSIGEFTARFNDSLSKEKQKEFLQNAKFINANRSQFRYYINNERTPSPTVLEYISLRKPKWESNDREKAKKRTLALLEKYELIDIADKNAYTGHLDIIITQNILIEKIISPNEKFTILFELAPYQVSKEDFKYTTKLLKCLKDEGHTIICYIRSFHDAERIIVNKIADRIVYIAEGEIIYDGIPNSFTRTISLHPINHSSYTVIKDDVNHFNQNSYLISEIKNKDLMNNNNQKKKYNESNKDKLRTDNSGEAGCFSTALILLLVILL